MAYTIPTAADLKLRYPAFNAVDDAVIEAYIADAPVDQTWLERDYSTAIMLWAAHSMTLNGIGASEIEGYAAAGVTRLKSGTLDVSFSAGGSAQAGYGATGYGRQYAELLRKNKGGPRVVSGPVGDCEWGPTAIQNDGTLLPWAF